MAVFYRNVNLPISNNTSIATFATANAGKLVLPATGLLVEYDGTINFIKLGYSSSLSITSTFDLTGITFSVYGVNNGYYITETIAGPNNNTISTSNMFEKIISVAISGNIANQFTLGSGRDVAVYGKANVSNVSNTRSNFNSLTNSPDAPVGGLAVNSAFLFNINLNDKILLDKTKLNANVNRPISYELIQNGFTQDQLRAGFNNNLVANAGLQYVFIAINGSLTFPVFYSVSWLDQG